MQALARCRGKVATLGEFMAHKDIFLTLEGKEEIERLREEEEQAEEKAKRAHGCPVAEAKVEQEQEQEQEAAKEDVAAKGTPIRSTGFLPPFLRPAESRAVGPAESRRRMGRNAGSGG